jgi:hypothetical protein
VILFFAFVVGWISAKFIGQYAFVADNTSYVKIDNSPRTKILAAKIPIPAGQEILAEHISFVDVPIAELPARSITNFNAVYRRRPAFPIPKNCPICEDLLITKDNEHNPENSVKFIPAGYAIISFDIEWLNKRTNLNANNQLDHNQLDRNNQIGSLFVTKNNESENNESGQILKKGNRVDIRVITRRIPKGNLATIKEQVLQTYADKFYIDSVSELVLENVQIHNFTSYGRDAVGNSLQKVSFLLEESKIEQLANAAKKGRLRIVAKQTEKSNSTQPSDITPTETNIAETKEYKGIKSYKPEPKTQPITTTTSENINAKNKNLTNEIVTVNSISAKIEPTDNSELNKNLVSTTNDKSTSIENNKEKNLPLSESESGSEIAVNHAPSLFVIPLYLRNLWDYQISQHQNAGVNNRNNNNNDNIRNVTAIASSINQADKFNVEQETIGSASSHNSSANSASLNKEKQKKNNVNNQALVFKKPQINYIPDDQNDDAGRSRTSKYMFGNNNINSTDK